MSSTSIDCKYVGVLFPIKELVESALSGELEELNKDQIEDPNGIIMRFFTLAQQQKEACRQTFPKERYESHSSNRRGVNFSQQQNYGWFEQKNNMMHSRISYGGEFLMNSVKGIRFEVRGLNTDFFTYRKREHKIMFTINDFTLLIEVQDYKDNLEERVEVTWNGKLEKYATSKEKQMLCKNYFVLDVNDQTETELRELKDLKKKLEIRRNKDITKKIIENFVSDSFGDMYRFVTPTQADRFNRLPQKQMDLQASNLTTTRVLEPSFQPQSLFNIVQDEHAADLWRNLKKNQTLRQRMDRSITKEFREEGKDEGDEQFEEIDHDVANQVSVTINGYFFEMQNNF